MNRLSVYIESKEIQYAGDSISSENYLPSITPSTHYTSRELHKVTIVSDYFRHDMANKPYKAFFMNADDYIYVSKWLNGVMVSEILTKFVFEILDNCTYDIQLKNTSGDNIDVSYGFYYGD